MQTKKLYIDESAPVVIDSLEAPGIYIRRQGATSTKVLIK